MHKTLTIVAPVYNEELVIESFVSEVLSVLDQVREKYSFKILLVVDKSIDESAAIVKKMAEKDTRVQGLFLSSRFGHQNSLMAGIDHCRSDVVVMMDSDLQHPPQVIIDLLEKYEMGFEIVQTVRIDEFSGIFKKTTSNLFYRLINKLSDHPITPAAADFRLLSSKVVNVLQTHIKERNIFLRGMIGWLGFKTCHLSFKAAERRVGSSKYSLQRLLNFAISGVVSSSKRPLKAAMIFGFFFSLLAFALTLWIIFSWLQDRSLPSGWTTLATVISFYSGVQLVFLGVLGEYIGFIFDEVKGRPRYIIEDSINL